MNDELKNILSNQNPAIRQEKILEYLHRDLTEEERHELEMAMADDEFFNDAVEGLEQVPNPSALQDVVNRLNKNLKDQVRQQQERRQKRKPNYQSWLYMSIILIILLAVISYFVIRKLQGS